MPSQQDPSDIETGPGKLPIDVATAATNLFAIGSSSILASLMDLVNRELAVVEVSSIINPGSDIPDITLFGSDGPFWVGDSPSDLVTDLFKVVRGSLSVGTDQEIFNPATGLYAQVISITGASIGDGFYAGNLTLTLSTPIPAGTQYKVYYAKRTTLGEVAPDATSFPAIKRVQDRQRFPEFNRTGTAPTSIAGSSNIVTGGYLDPYMGQWKAVLRATDINGSPIPAYGGSMGFVNVGRKKNVIDPDDHGQQGHQSAGFYTAYVKETTGTGTMGGANPLTRINPASAALAISAAVVELAATDFFRTATESAIRPGVDMLEVTRATGRPEVYVITAFDAADVRRATLRTIGGAVPGFTASEAITCRWVRPSFFVGGDNDPALTLISPPERFHFVGMGNFVTGVMTDDPAGVEYAQEPPFFGAARNTRVGADLARDSWDAIAFRWGGFNISSGTVSEIGRRDVLGELWGDGSVETYGGRQRGLNANRAEELNVATTQTYEWFPPLISQVTFIGSSTSPFEITIALSGSYTPEAGDKITFFLDCAVTGDAMTVVYPSNFKFSGNDDLTPLAVPTVAKFEGTYSNGNFYFTRTDYYP